MRDIFVDNCHDCPFSMRDMTGLIYNCEASEGEGIGLDNGVRNWEEFPKDNVHENCPLKEGGINVSLNK